MISENCPTFERIFSVRVGLFRENTCIRRLSDETERRSIQYKVNRRTVPTKVEVAFERREKEEEVECGEVKMLKNDLWFTVGKIPFI